MTKPALSPVFHVGTAAWSIPSVAKPLFGEEGSHLERYAARFKGVEINTSFYRDHKPATYEKWARTTPADFRFAVKLSRAFTHDQHLQVDEAVLAVNLQGILGLGGKLGTILIQLPPKLAFHEATARDFFGKFRRSYAGPAVIEPRHRSWGSDRALAALQEFRIGKVLADPEPCVTDSRFQEASPEILYVRWHGSPVIYESRYELESLAGLYTELAGIQDRYRAIWVVFDNTTFGWATVNALEFEGIIRSKMATSMDIQGVAP